MPEDVTGEELDAEARAELRTLPKDLAARVARHLVMAGRLVDEDPETAYRHAKAARRMASRVALTREAAGLAAYHAGEWADTLAELRAARRLGGDVDAYLPIMADAERGLGRPERALDLAKSPEAKRLDQAERIELRIVEAGARRDLGQHAAAVVTLQIPELKDRRLRPWSARLFYAYADALTAADREEEASDWFARAAAADRDGETDAAERYAELEGLEIIDTEEEDEIFDHSMSPFQGDEPPSDTQPAPEDQAPPALDEPADQNEPVASDVSAPQDEPVTQSESSAQATFVAEDRLVAEDGSESPAESVARDELATEDNPVTEDDSATQEGSVRQDDSVTSEDTATQDNLAVHDDAVTDNSVARDDSVTLDEAVTADGLAAKEESLALGEEDEPAGQDKPAERDE